MTVEWSHSNDLAPASREPGQEVPIVRLLSAQLSAQSRVPGRLLVQRGRRLSGTDPDDGLKFADGGLSHVTERKRLPEPSQLSVWPTSAGSGGGRGFAEVVGSEVAAGGDIPGPDEEPSWKSSIFSSRMIRDPDARVRASSDTV